MTYQKDSTLSDQLLEQLSKSGKDALSDLFRTSAEADAGRDVYGRCQHA